MRRSKCNGLLTGRRARPHGRAATCQVRGKPILNTAYAALRLLHDEEFIDFAVIGGLLFRDGLPPSARLAGLDRQAVEARGAAGLT
jgi:hypothetical protein